MSVGSEASAAVLAVDGGNSKADIALVGADGTLLAALRGPTVSHQAVGLEPGMDALDALVGRALAMAGQDPAARPAAGLGVYCLAGADFPSDVRSLRGALGRRRLAATDLVLNDTFAALRAGSDRPWGVVVICGAGMNALGIAPDGRTVRFAALGSISGDRGGGRGLAMAGLGAAVRGRDGRGPRTSLERLVPAHFGLGRPGDVTRALYLGRLPEARLGELSAVVFAAAGEGDRVARSIVDELADEAVTWAVAAIRRLHLTRRDVPVALAGGVFSTADVPFLERIRAGVRRVAPAARIEPLSAPPVLGAALLGLDRLDLPDRPAVEARLRAALTPGRLGPPYLEPP
jgi:N-acetylglucosamine kinase-like BadF-type ATPase